MAPDRSRCQGGGLQRAGCRRYRPLVKVLGVKVLGVKVLGVKVLGVKVLGVKVLGVKVLGQVRHGAGDL
ncbi:MAG: hypothetical protein ACYCV4_08445 [Dermatophilaceae bacterium]